jgi:histidine triad (HIT) family protein
MNDCLFCKIIAKQLPSASVYEDDDVYAFLDIHPVNPGHVLIVPKQHVDDFLSSDPAMLSKLIQATQKIARAVVAATGTIGFNLEENNGAIAGQMIRHLHLHIIPRRADDGLKHWPGMAYEEGKDVEIAQKIQAALTNVTGSVV